MGRGTIFYDKYAGIKRRIFLLMLVMTFISLGAGLGILKLSNLKTVGMGLDTIYHDRVRPLKQLKMLSDIYSIMIVNTATKVANDVIPWHEGRRNLDQAMGRISGLWGEYLKTYLTEEEKKEAQELQCLFDTADQSLVKLQGILAKEDRKGLSEYIKRDLYPVIEPVTRKIDKLFQLQVRIVKDINDTERVRYRISWSVGLASIGMSILFFLLALLQWRRFRGLLDSL